jgi:hypothetical protein
LKWVHILTVKQTDVPFFQANKAFFFIKNTSFFDCKLNYQKNARRNQYFFKARFLAKLFKKFVRTWFTAWKTPVSQLDKQNDSET